jgi:hypothetical protein
MFWNPDKGRPRSLAGSEPDYGKEGAEKYIPRERRADVLAKTMDSVSSVVSAAMPSLIAMETFYPNLPPEALKKYSLIGASVIVCGYVLEDSFRDDASRINYWYLGNEIEIATKGH